MRVEDRGRKRKKRKIGRRDVYDFWLAKEHSGAKNPTKNKNCHLSKEEAIHMAKREIATVTSLSLYIQDKIYNTIKLASSFLSLSPNISLLYFFIIYSKYNLAYVYVTLL